jgi:hypothetical protein
MPYIHGMPGLSYYFRDGFLTMLRDVETHDLIFRLSGVRNVEGFRAAPYWLFDRKTWELHELVMAKVCEVDRAATVH